MLWQDISDTWDHLSKKAEAAWDRCARSLKSIMTGKGEELAKSVRKERHDVRDRVEESLGGWTSESIGRRDRGPQRVLAPLVGAGLGAGLMYILDPKQGRRRRALVRDQFVHTLYGIDDAIGVVSHDLSNRSHGAFSRVRTLPNRLTGEAVSDDILLGRIRAKLGRCVSHPSAIEVDISGSRISLSGPILAREVDNLLKSIASVPGVTEVESRLQIHEQPGDIPALQGGREYVGERAELWQSNWSPTARMLVGTAGGALLIAGVGRRGLAGLTLGGLGAGLLARAVTNLPFQSWTRMSKDHTGAGGASTAPSTAEASIEEFAPGV